MNNPILTNKKREKYFKEIFVNLIYDNMAMEDEAVFSKKNIAERYKLQIDNLIKEGAHNKIVIPNSYYVKDKAVLSRN
jgi:ribonuclease HII